MLSLLLLRLLRRLTCALPERWVRPLGHILGWLAFRVFRVRRAVTLANLQAARGVGPALARRLAAQLYVHLGTGAVEMLRVSRLTQERAAELLGQEGLARLRRLLDEHRGILILSAHLGHWDLLACAGARCGLPVTVVTRSIKASSVDRFWMEERQACGVRLLPAVGSAAAVLKALRQRHAVAMLIDQHEPGGEVVSFFGRAARTSTSLARMARATRLPVVPVFLPRSHGTFRLEIGDPVPLRWTADRRADLHLATQQLTEVIERAIERYPEQWLWLHRRWKVVDPAAAVPAAPT